MEERGIELVGTVQILVVSIGHGKDRKQEGHDGGSLFITGSTKGLEPSVEAFDERLIYLVERLAVLGNKQDFHGAFITGCCWVQCD